MLKKLLILSTIAVTPVSLVCTTSCTSSEKQEYESLVEKDIKNDEELTLTEIQRAGILSKKLGADEAKSIYNKVYKKHKEHYSKDEHEYEVFVEISYKTRGRLTDDEKTRFIELVKKLGDAKILPLVKTILNKWEYNEEFLWERREYKALVKKEIKGEEKLTVEEISRKYELVKKIGSDESKFIYAIVNKEYNGVPFPEEILNELRKQKESNSEITNKEKIIKLEMLIAKLGAKNSEHNTN